jgi:hypothetical protein
MREIAIARIENSENANLDMKSLFFRFFSSSFFAKKRHNCGFLKSILYIIDKENYAKFILELNGAQHHIPSIGDFHPIFP